MTFGESVKTCFRKYAVFKGRACRSEFWWFVLFTLIVDVALDFVLGLFMIPLLFKGQFNAESITSISTPFSIASLVVGLAILLPSLGVMTRRLHDTNRSGWWVFFFYLLSLVILVVTAMFGLFSFAFGENPANTADDFPFVLLLVLVILCLLLIAFGIVLLVWFCQRGTIGYNKYGSDPLADTYIDVELTHVES